MASIKYRKARHIVENNIPFAYLRTPSGRMIDEANEPESYSSVFDHVLKDREDDILAGLSAIDTYYFHRYKFGYSRIFGNETKFLQGYEKWLSKFIERRDRDVENAKKTIQRYEKIQGIDPYEISDFTVTWLVYGKRIPCPVDPLPDIFARSRTTEKIPWISYRDSFTIFNRIQRDHHGENPMASYDENEIITFSHNGRVGHIKYFENELTLKFASNEKTDLAMQIFNEAFPSFLDLEFDVDEIEGVFKVESFDISKEIFMDLFMNSETINDHLYLNEKSKNSLYREKPQIGMLSTIKDVVAEVEFFKKSLIVTIVEGSTYEENDRFLELFQRALQVCYEVYDDIYPEYRRFYNQYRTVDVEQYFPEDPGKTIDYLRKQNTSALLAKQYPDMFKSGYARQVCQANKQPTPLPESFIDAEAIEITSEKGTYVHQIMKFPREGNRRFICLNPDIPYPGISKSNGTSEYEWLPCCFKRDNINDPNSNYNKYMRGEKITENKNSTTLIRTNKIVSMERQGVFSPVLTSYLNELEPGDYKRIGVPNDENSFIHCVLRAKDQSYISLDEEGRRKYARDFRVSILERVHQEVAYQQFPNGEIEEYVMSHAFFDPLLTYKLLEEIFDLEIYIFDINASKLKPLLQLPYNTGYNVFPRRARKNTLLILRHMGSESDNLPFPQCEIIRKDKTFLFRPEIGKKLHDVLKEMSRTFYWSIEDQNIVTQDNLLSQIDYADVLPGSAFQILDSHGNLRVLIRNRIAYQTLPSSPLNLPLAQGVPSYKSVDEIVKYTGTPSNVVVSNGKVTALSYSAGDINQAIIVPCIPTKKYLDLPRINIGTFFFDSHREQKFKDYTDLRRNANRLIMFIKYLYSISRMPIKEFVESAFGIYRKVDHRKTRIPRIFPDTVDACMEYFIRKNPHASADGRILVTEKFVERIHRVLVTVRKGADSKYYSQIPNYYEDGTLYAEKSASEIILRGREELNEYIHRRPEVSKYIQKSINKDWMYISDPFVYQETQEDTEQITDQNSKMYIVQNVKGGSKKRAINVGIIWATKRINLGFNASESQKSAKSAIYTLEEFGKLTRNGSDESVRLLQYEKGFYGALLRVF